MKELLICMFVILILSSFNLQSDQDNTFSIVILPDTQYYSLYDGENGYPKTYRKQTQWIADHAVSENIKFVVHMGDMTHKNTIREWMIADDAHEVLDQAGIPYSVVPGNHDYPGDGDVVLPDSELYNQYFGPSRFSNTPWYGGSFGNVTNDNNYCFFNHENFKFLVISLEFAPSKDVLCWADQLISSYPDHNVILATHCYQLSNTQYATCNTNYNVVGSSGQHIWNELVRRHSNILFVLSGHIGNDGYNLKSGNAGNCVHQILTDYQLEKWKDEDYGNGWMRQLKFNPSIGTVEIESFSVFPNVITLNNPNYSADPNHPDHKFTIENVFLTPQYSRKQISNTFNDLYVHTAESGNQLKPEIAANNETFVAVWEDDSDGNGFTEIFARKFHLDGCENIAPFTVNQISSGQQRNPHVDMAADGSFVVVWEDDHDNNGFFQILAAGYDKNGQRLFSDIVVNAVANGQQYRPRVGMHDNGTFIVVWEDDQDDNGDFNIVATGFNKFGTQKRIQDFTVNQQSNGQHRKPDIAVSQNDSFIIVWEDDDDGNGFYQIYAAGFSAISGNRAFSDMTVNQVAAGQQFKPKVDIDQSGHFTIVWEDDNNSNSIFQILGAHFNFNGQKVGNDFIVKTEGTGQLRNPDISKNKTGDYIIIWEDDSDGNMFFQIKAKGYKSNNTQLVEESTINSDGSGNQQRPSIALNDQAIYISTWEDDLDLNGEWQILANGHDLTTDMPIERDCTSSCLSNLNLSGNQNIDHTYQSEELIQSSASINANIKYSSGNGVILQSGFATNNVFQAIMEGCN